MSEKYDTFIIWNERKWCWYCGRGSEHVPSGWYAPWFTERAHITNQPRRCDERAVVALCSQCHKLSHGILLALDERTPTPPTLANMLWLKMRFDPKCYDRAFLAANHIGALPRAVAPPKSVINEYQARRGSVPNGRRSS